MAEVVEAGSLFRGEKEDTELIQLIAFLQTEERRVTFEMFVPVCVANGCKLELQQPIIMGGAVQEYASVLRSPLACCRSLLPTICFLLFREYLCRTNWSEMMCNHSLCN